MAVCKKCGWNKNPDGWCPCKPVNWGHSNNRGRSAGGRSSGGAGSSWQDDAGRFEGKAIKVRVGGKGVSGRFEFLYGGAAHPDGPGHGHVICNDGENISFWRLPVSEGVGRNGKGRVVIDDRFGTMHGDPSLDNHWSS